MAPPPQGPHSRGRPRPSIRDEDPPDDDERRRSEQQQPGGAAQPREVGVESPQELQRPAAGSTGRASACRCSRRATAAPTAANSSAATIQATCRLQAHRRDAEGNCRGNRKGPAFSIIRRHAASSHRRDRRRVPRAVPRAEVRRAAGVATRGRRGRRARRRATRVAAEDRLPVGRRLPRVARRRSMPSASPRRRRCISRSRRTASSTACTCWSRSPITETPEQARALIASAARHGRVLQVGHLERFNAAILALAGTLGTPRFVESHRLAPFKERGTDVNVVLDLMIHDIDLIQSLVGAPIESIDAVGASVFSAGLDIANARIRYANGCVANTTASRVSMKMERKLRLFQDDAYVSIDLQQKVLTDRAQAAGRHRDRAGAGRDRGAQLRAGRRAQARDRGVPALDPRRPRRRWSRARTACARSRRPSASPNWSRARGRSHEACALSRHATSAGRSRIEDLRRIARRRLPNFSFEYVEGGAEDEVALRRNRDVFERIAWLPRTLAGVGTPGPRDARSSARPATCRWSSRRPVSTACSGRRATSRSRGPRPMPAFRSRSAPCRTIRVAKLTAEVPQRIWFQLYPFKDAEGRRPPGRPRGSRRVAGTLVVTTDVPMLGAREWDQRNYRAPMKLSLREHARRAGAPGLAAAGDDPARRAAVREPQGVPAARRRVGARRRALHGHADQREARAGRTWSGIRGAAGRASWC